MWAQSITVTGSVFHFLSGTNTQIAAGSLGTSFTLTDNLVIGGRFGPVGELTIQDGAIVSVAGLTGLPDNNTSTGTLNLNNGGVLQTSYLVSGGGTASVNFNGGILRVNDNEANFLQSFQANAIKVNSAGAYVDTQAFTVGINNSTGIITGSGSFTKQGSGTLSITGSNTWGGSTSVAAGTLGFTTYTQSSSQTLTIGASSIANYGKLNVSGVATFNAGANLAVDVASINTLAKDQTLSGVISAGTLNATTFNVTDNSALLNFVAVRNGSAIDLNIVNASTIYDAVRAQSMAPAYGAARILDALPSSGDTGVVSSAFNRLPTQSSVARAVNQTLPVISGNQAIQGTLSTYQNLIQQRNAGNATGLSSGDALSNKNGWGKVFGSRADQDDRSGAAGFKADTWGLALGGDAEVAPGARFGLAYGYAKTSVNGNTDLSGTAQRANIDSHVVSAYGSKDMGSNRTFSFQGDIGVSGNKSTRQIDFGGLNRTARADYRTYSAHMGAAIAQAFELNQKTTFTPALRADYTWLKSQSYNEIGADALNLSVDSNKTDALVIGADTYLQYRISNVSRIDANIGIGYDTINKQGNIVAAYAGVPGQSFVTTGIDHSPWLVRGGIGYSMIAASGTEINFRYDATGRSDFLNHTASVRAKWAF
ncbi:autotransporter domain-containing protein [Herminiimonas sp. KBW02]|uniref:autotransporter outer membrane beta-barrel domain-containing protein n=1 Tax=Herminiimonas sp. KBW02 TaxID=2153363 RepID=UPI001F42F7CE|nr:autotransporter outer membrane beta-barrel domain-containing protein [Herminiimonas sp. KBW02]